jgi:hypothetical protein
VGIDIDLNVGDIRHPTLTSVIPISETNMSDWKTSFRYRKCSDIDIRVQSDIRHWRKQNYFSLQIRTVSLGMVSKHYDTKLLWLSVPIGMSDIGKNFIPISDIMSDSALSDIGSSDIRLSLISLITDIGLSAHLCWYIAIIFTTYFSRYNDSVNQYYILMSRNYSVVT